MATCSPRAKANPVDPSSSGRREVGQAGAGALGLGLGGEGDVPAPAGLGPGRAGSGNESPGRGPDRRFWKRAQCFRQSPGGGSRAEGRGLDHETLLPTLVTSVEAAAASRLPFLSPWPVG